MKCTSTTTGLLTLVAMIVLGALSAGSASASTFLWTGPLPGLVLILSDNTQVFTTEPGGLKVECKHFGAHGIASNGISMAAKTIKLVGTYSKCTAAGLGAKITTAEYVLNSDESVAVVGSPIVITVPEAGCSIKVNSGAPNNKLKSIRFLNQPNGTILGHVEVTNITSLGSNGACGTPGEEKKEGSYTGLLSATLHGGTLKWDLNA